MDDRLPILCPKSDSFARFPPTPLVWALDVRNRDTPLSLGVVHAVCLRNARTGI